VGWVLKSEEIMSNIKEQYQVIEWKQPSLLEHATAIICNAQFNIHSIELDNKETVYIVPEAFYKAATAALKKEQVK
jgi:hypothetical protein